MGDVIQPSHPMSPPSPPALNFSQHQGHDGKGAVKIEVVCSKGTKENIHGIRSKVENLKLNKAEFSHGGRALYFGSRFHILARIPGDSVNTLLRWCLNARGSNHPHSAKWWGEGPSGSEKWMCWSGCSPKMAWGLPMSRTMHWGEWPQHLQEAQEQPCSKGQADGRRGSHRASSWEQRGWYDAETTEARCWAPHQCGSKVRGRLSGAQVVPALKRAIASRHEGDAQSWRVTLDLNNYKKSSMDY